MKFATSFVLLTLASQVSAQLTIRFQPYITTRAQYLGDILLITHDKSRLSTLMLDSKPRANEVINKKQMMDWVEHQIGSFNYQWKGKNTAVVKQPLQTKGTDLLNKAQRELTLELKKEAYDSIKITPKTVIKDSEFPLSAYSIEVPKHSPPFHQVCVRLNYKNRSILVWFEVKAYQKVLVAKHHIKSHTAVMASDFILKVQNISGLKDKPYSQLPQSQWLKDAIKKDHILTQHHLTNKPQVIKGQPVKINIVSPKISIITEALAQKDGYIGQKIRMKNTTTHQYFDALVTAENQAEVRV